MVKKQLFQLLFVLTIVCIQKVNAGIITVGTDAGCDFNTIQAAVDSGSSIMDIRVTNQKIYNAVEIINDDVLDLSGGFDDCASAATIDAIANRPLGFTPTQIDAQDNVTGLIIDINNVISQNMNISGFEIYNGSPKGIDVKSSGVTASLFVEISKTSIHDNHQTGLSVVGTFTDVSFQGSIYNNITGSTGGVNGGGVYCFAGQFTLQEGSAIYNNMAISGAGLYADDCGVSIFAGDNNPLDSLQYGIFNNHAFFYGGGVRFKNSNVIASGSNTHPVSFSGNSSDRFGGGIYVSSGSVVELINTRIEGNQANNLGGGIYSVRFPNDVAFIPEISIKSSNSGCSYAEICSRVIGNKVFSNNNGEGGAAFMLLGESDLNVYQTLIDGNRAYHGNVLLSSGATYLQMEGNLISHNYSLTSSGNSASIFETTNGANIDVAYTTIADNQASRIFYNVGSVEHILAVNKTIVSSTQNATIVNSGNTSSVNFYCSLLHRTGAEAFSDADTIIGDAGFVGNGNYQLALTSMAVNPVCVHELMPLYLDVSGEDRTLDVAADMGAYENVLAREYVFSNGFEE